MPKYSIIIPVCGNEKITNECIDSIARGTSDFELIIVDNGSGWKRRGPEKIIRNETNLGFPVAVNQGIKAAVGDVIVILNNDTLVTPDWLEHLEKHFEKFDMVGPVTNFISGPQQIELDVAASKDNADTIARDVYSKNYQKTHPYHRLVFFCVAMKREVVDRVGLFDEQFSPGNFEDDDFCLRAIEAGFRLGIAQDTFIYHIGCVTFKTLKLAYNELLETNRAKFQAKWPAEKYLELQSKCLDNCLDLKSLKKNRLALVMVVKDEEVGLERAILSCRDFVDEIVIAVDNATTDRTEEIAKKCGAVIKHFDWHDDFSEARNFANQGVRSKWILMLDGHEYVVKAPDLEKYLESKHDGLMCSIEMERGFTFGYPRIYRNGLQFFGKVHERPTARSTEPYPEFLIKHDRFGGQADEAAERRAQQRDEQVHRIMGAEFRRSKKNVRAAFHLALQAQGREDFTGAIRWWRRYLRHSKDRGERWFAFFNLSLCHLGLRHFFRAFWAASRADDETPGRWEIQKVKGLIFYRRKKWEKAMEYFVKSLDDKKCIIAYKPWPRDLASIFNLVGECLFNLGVYDRAVLAFTRAAELCTDKEVKKILEARAKVMVDVLKNAPLVGGSFQSKQHSKL